MYTTTGSRNPSTAWKRFRCFVPLQCARCLCLNKWGETGETMAQTSNWEKPEGLPNTVIQSPGVRTAALLKWIHLWIHTHIYIHICKIIYHIYYVSTHVSYCFLRWRMHRASNVLHVHSWSFMSIAERPCEILWVKWRLLRRCDTDSWTASRNSSESEALNAETTRRR